MRLRHGTTTPMATTAADEARYRTTSDHVAYDPRQLHIDRYRNDQRLKSRFEHIFSKYEHDFEGVADEIEISTGKIVVNNGHLQHMEHEADPGNSASSLFAQAFQEEMDHEAENDEDGECDDAEGGEEEEHERYRDEPLHSSGIEDMPTLISRPPSLSIISGFRHTETPSPRVARVTASGNTPQRPDVQLVMEQVPDAPSSAITISGLATPLLARVPVLYQSLRDAQRDSGRRSVAPEAVKALGVSIANQLTQYMPESAQKKKKAKEPRLSLPTGVSDPVWAFPELPASGTPKRQRRSSPVRNKIGSSPVPYPVRQESLWTAEGIVRPRKRRRTKTELANGTPVSAMPLIIRPLSSGKTIPNAELRRCWNCSLTRTTSWRKGPHGQALCMSCGTYFERYRRMKPFDSPTPEPEDRATKHGQSSANTMNGHEAEEAQANHELDEPFHDDQGIHDEGVITQSSPPSLRDEVGDVRLSQEQAHHNLGMPIINAIAVPGEETMAFPAMTEAATHIKPVVFATLQKHTAEDFPKSAVSTPRQFRPRIVDEGVKVGLQDHQSASLMDDYVNDFEGTPVGQLERRLNPLLHHGPPSASELAGADIMSSAVKTRVLESSMSTNSTSSGHGTSEQHDGVPTHNVLDATLWKNSAWNNSQDELLLELREEQDLEWEDISALLPGHSSEAVERRYELLIDAAAHTMRISSQTTAPEAVALLQHTSTGSKGTSTKGMNDILPGKHHVLRIPEIDNLSPAHQRLSASTASKDVEVSPSDCATSSTMAESMCAPAASVQPHFSPADDCSPLPDYFCHSEDAVDTITHKTPPAGTTIGRTESGATPSRGDRQDFAAVNEVFDNAEPSDPSQQLFREMGSSPSSAPALEDPGCATNTPPLVEKHVQVLEPAAHATQMTSFQESQRIRIRSPYRTRKNSSDQSARNSVVQAEDSRLCSQALGTLGGSASNSEHRPRLSYAQLVEAAFIAHDRRSMRSIDVFTWVEYNYPWFRKLKDSPLKARIRATLSAKPQFERVDVPDGTKAWRFLKALNPISAKIRSRRRSRRIAIGGNFADRDAMDVSQFIEGEDELATPKTTSIRKSPLRKLVSARMGMPVPIFVQSTKKMAKRRSSGRTFLDVDDTGTPVREVDPDEDELAAL
ncbi:hypothetical protein DOTSEDRAFT_71862 [Dothistroma septosporum NZE10]|uniref:GATA-type domain-containing protein n=1 Tax=Dothistroma septosporum (strain NZE10 / CBS 128990) TaxID=675120 RepID=N1PML9_DOTSN|nr:hypothetical protein DOTSEDRAFT_71862 [Dothistroma septosporum NZE10]